MTHLPRTSRRTVSFRVFLVLAGLIAAGRLRSQQAATRARDGGEACRSLLSVAARLAIWQRTPSSPCIRPVGRPPDADETPDRYRFATRGAQPVRGQV
jgi:hypothetical protein